MHKLVTIGDSLTQGFQSGAISRTHLSYPALIANAMKLDPLAFLVPDFSARGGLPANIDVIARLLADKFGANVNPLELLPALWTVREHMDGVEDHWERGAGTLPSGTGPLHHNLAVWGFEVADADTLTERICRDAIPKPKDDALSQLPEHPMYRTARRVLNPSLAPSHETFTQVAAAKKLAKDGGIENLVFWLGANNCLGTVLELDIRESTDDDLTKLSHERECNLWRPEHFEVVYKRVAAKVAKIAAKHTFVGTIPHVTIPPVTRGVSLKQPERDDEGYYEFYTRFWVWDDDFRKAHKKYDKLTRKQAKYIDQTIDQYNDVIRAEAKKHGWHVVELCQVLDALAFRRQAGKPSYKFPKELVAALSRNEHTRHRVIDVDGSRHVLLDTRYLREDAGQIEVDRRYQGGIFSLDGVHGTTLGYGIIAHEMLKVMHSAWRGKQKYSLNWDAIVAADELVRRPPVNLGNLRDLLGLLSTRGFLDGVMRALAGMHD